MILFLIWCILKLTTFLSIQSLDENWLCWNSVVCFLHVFNSTSLCIIYNILTIKELLIFNVVLQSHVFFITKILDLGSNHCRHLHLIFLSWSEFRPVAQKWSEFGLILVHLVLIPKIMNMWSNFQSYECYIYLTVSFI